MEKVISLIKEFFKKNDWKFKFRTKKNKTSAIFTSVIDMGTIVGSLNIFINVDESDYVVLAVLNNKAEKNNFSSIAEYLHKANYGLKNGNFEMDYNDGEIRYKTYVNFENTDISEDIIAASIIIALSMFDQYGPGLIKTMCTGIVSNDDFE